MIVLDTNVISEPLRPHPDPRVLSWLDGQAIETLHLTTITIAELRAGIAVLPAGRRRRQLEQALDSRVVPHFEGRILGFGPDAAAAFGPIYAGARTQGNSMEFADCAIAAIAHSNGYLLATRNVKDFAGTGIELLNPWVAKG